MTTTNLPKSALDLYEAPFALEYCDSYSHHICDRDGKRVLENVTYILSGHIAQALTEYWHKHASIEQANHIPDATKMVKHLPTCNWANPPMVVTGAGTMELRRAPECNCGAAPQAAVPVTETEPELTIEGIKEISFLESFRCAISYYDIKSMDMMLIEVGQEIIIQMQGDRSFTLKAYKG